ncbi:MAG: transcriptional regulator NrdR [Cyanobacteria bacterium MAG CAR4_bin_6]|nr:transcriptional regulator NrdR [Cyanobacteria bacterium MAG CAR4_bin_6]MCY4235768.1 transcriptional regulator NrdR [Cyanobacteria bacterium MAG CAR2_bin_4]MCY4331752.1 transcriptional regulator NrdR [Cyanobacteria bacterium MAG CAR1_bin_15]
MQCPTCRHSESHVLESRPADLGRSVRRRRECLRCHERFTTYERVEVIPLTVVKRDGRRESFNQGKMFRGLSHACEKTTVAPEQVRLIVEEVESFLQQRNYREITSKELGELVLDRLGQLSEVAYIRFASVYGQFASVDDFSAILRLLEKRGEQPLRLRSNISTPGP